MTLARNLLSVLDYFGEGIGPFLFLAAVYGAIYFLVMS